MHRNRTINQDSVSLPLEVNDRFFQSQNCSNQFIPDYNLDSSQQQNQPISDYVQLSQTNNKNDPQFQSLSQQNQLLKKQNIDFGSRSSLKQLQKDKKIEKQTKQQKANRKKPTSQKKKHNSKNYRDRKKQYIQKLQDQHQYYKTRTAQLQQKVILLQRQICELKYDHDNHHKSGYQKQYGKDLQFLKGTIDENKLPHSDIVQIAIKLREKYGPAGHDRKMILNYYMSEYINSTMGDFQKYIFSSVLKKGGPFGESKTSLDQKIDEVLKLNQVQKLNLHNKVIPQLYPLAVSYSNCCKNIYKDYVSLLQEANKFHKMMAKGLDYVKIPQLMNLVIWFQQNKNMLQVRRLKQEWIRIFSGQIQPEPFYR